MQAVFDLLPNSHYNPVFVVGDADEVIEILSNRSNSYLVYGIADIDTASIANCTCHIIRDFEEIETVPVLQEKVADFLGSCILQGKQIIILSKKELTA